MENGKNYENTSSNTRTFDDNMKNICFVENTFNQTRAINA